MATLQDLDRAYLRAAQDIDGADARANRRYHSAERAAYTLRDRVRADMRAERAATDGRK